MLWNILRSRAQRAYAQAGSGVLPPGNPGMQPGYGSGYPPYPPPGGGSGLMGNLASGLAIGAGVAAGEELVRHVIDGNGNVVQAPPRICATRRRIRTWGAMIRHHRR